MTSVREAEQVVREYRATTPGRNRLLAMAHRHPRGAFMPAHVGVCSTLVLFLMLAIGLALRF